jgi:hypothetical protein
MNNTDKFQGIPEIDNLRLQFFLKVIKTMHGDWK